MRLKLLIFLQIMFVWMSTLSAEVKPAHEVKGLFLINVLRYCEWPDDTNKKLRVVFLGESQVFKSFKKLENQAIGKRKLEVKQFRRYDSKLDLSQYHCIFVSSDHKVAFETVTKSVAGKSVLTVGENPWFLESGGILNFMIVKGRVRFKINFESLKASSIKVSSNVLKFSYKED